MAQESPKNTVDLTSLLHVNLAERNELYSEAIQLLNSMKSSSSCNQHAVTDLVASCQLLDGTGNDQAQGSSLSMDLIKSLYAARLAVCELSGAGATVPEKCVPIISSQRDDQFRAFSQKTSWKGDGTVSVPELEPCLRSLESKPQWWTSYSNNRQNAVVMCQAARFDIERDQLLKHHRNLADITFGLSQSLNDSLSDAAAEAVKQRQFFNDVDTLRLKLFRDIQETDSFARNLFLSLIRDMERRMEKAGNTIHESMGDMLSYATTLSRVEPYLDPFATKTDHR